MGKDPSNPKCIKAEVLTPRVSIGPTVKEVIRIEVVGQITEPEDNMEVIDKIIQTTIFKGTQEDTEDKIVEENMGIIGIMIPTEVGIGQEKGHSQGTTVAIRKEVPVTVDQHQGLELVLIKIG